MQLGDDLHEEGVFVGYFLKTMAYTAYNTEPVVTAALGPDGMAAATAPAHPVVSRRDWRGSRSVGIPVVLLIVARHLVSHVRASGVKLLPADGDRRGGNGELVPQRDGRLDCGRRIERSGRRTTILPCSRAARTIGRASSRRRSRNRVRDATD